MKTREYENLTQKAKEIFNYFDISYEDVDILYNPMAIKVKRSLDDKININEFANLLAHEIFPKKEKEMEEKRQQISFGKNEMDVIQTVVDGYKTKQIEEKDLNKLLKKYKHEYTLAELSRKFNLSTSEIAQKNYIDNSKTYIVPMSLLINMDLVIDLEDEEDINNLLYSIKESIQNESLKINFNENKLRKLQKEDRIKNFVQKEPMFLDELGNYIEESE